MEGKPDIDWHAVAPVRPALTTSAVLSERMHDCGGALGCMHGHVKKRCWNRIPIDSAKHCTWFGGDTESRAAWARRLCVSQTHESYTTSAHAQRKSAVQLSVPQVKMSLAGQSKSRKSSQGQSPGQVNGRAFDDTKTRTAGVPLGPITTQLVPRLPSCQH